MSDIRTYPFVPSVVGILKEHSVHILFHTALQETDKFCYPKCRSMCICFAAIAVLLEWCDLKSAVPEMLM
jgi:hypothetical protein